MADTLKTEASRQIAIRWFEEVWNQKNEAAIDEMFSAKGKAYGFPEADSILVGPEAFKLIYRTFVGAFPDVHLTLHQVIAEDDRVAILWSFEATHLGDHLGIPPTGRSITHHGAAFVIISDNQIVEGWNEIDMHNLFQKLH
jgi:predicted ester cyclase